MNETKTLQKKMLEEKMQSLMTFSIEDRIECKKAHLDARIFTWMGFDLNGPIEMYRTSQLSYVPREARKIFWFHRNWENRPMQKILVQEGRFGGAEFRYMTLKDVRDFWRRMPVNGWRPGILLRMDDEEKDLLQVMVSNRQPTDLRSSTDHFRMPYNPTTAIETVLKPARGRRPRKSFNPAHKYYEK